MSLACTIENFEDIGEVYRLPRIGTDGKHLTQFLRQSFIEEAAKTKRIQIFCIYGELSSIDVIISALDSKYSDCDVNVQIIFGPKIKNNNNNKKILESLFSSNRDKLFLYF
jgi:hypothetical protein